MLLPLHRGVIKHEGNVLKAKHNKANCTQKTKHCVTFTSGHRPMSFLREAKRCWGFTYLSPPSSRCNAALLYTHYCSGNVDSIIEIHSYKICVPQKDLNRQRRSWSFFKWYNVVVSVGIPTWKTITVERKKRPKVLLSVCVYGLKNITEHLLEYFTDSLTY